jgi:hypothetical protein
MTDLRKAVDAHYNAYEALNQAYLALSRTLAKEPGLIPQQDPRIDEMRGEIRHMRREIEEAVGRRQRLRVGHLVTTSADPYFSAGSVISYTHGGMPDSGTLTLGKGA